MKIVHDLFPAKVRVSAEYRFADDIDSTPILEKKATRVVDAVRVVLLDNVVMIAADSHNGPMLIFREKYDPTTLLILKNSKEAESRVVTESGKLILFKKDENCGCGSKLRAWNPYGTVNSVKDPTE